MLTSSLCVFFLKKNSYENDDGTHVEQHGELKEMNEDKEMGESVKGAYSYMGDDGKEYSIKYTADENGFRPVSKNFHFKILDKCALVNTSSFI